MKISFSMLWTTALVLASLAACEKNSTENENPRKSVSLTRAEEEVVENCSEFGFKGFQYLADNNESRDNIIFSPANVATLMGVIANGCEGSTLSQITDALGFENISHLNSASLKIITEFPELDKKTKLSIANAIWTRENGTIVKNSYTQALKDFYHGDITKMVDMGSTQTQQSINEWVQNNTSGMIHKWLDKPLPSGTLSYFASTLYFKGEWNDKFFINNTESFEFSNANGSISTPASMKGSPTVAYHEGPNAQSIMLPYGNGAYSMIFTLPNESKNISECIADIRSDEFKSYIKGNGIKGKISVVVPKFDITCKLILNQMLANLGVSDLFDSQACKFTGISTGNSCAISKIDHGVRVKIDETGTEVAAVTGAGMVETANPIITKLTFDRPFIFMIVENSTALPLVIGNINKL